MNFHSINTRQTYFKWIATIAEPNIERTCVTGNIYFAVTLVVLAQKF